MTGVDEGDKLRAEKVVIEALKITTKGVFRRTGGHNAQRAVAERNVECVVTKKMVLARGRE
jgi:hypothetical protein